MKKSRFFLALLFVSLLFVLFPATAKADMWDVPVGPGESFRWVFVTSGTRDGYSWDISEYNTFVNDAADAIGTSITGVVGKSSIAEIEWSAIASTPSTDAIVNIGASTSSIYTPTGSLVANGTTDMFDGSLYSPIVTTEIGGSYSGLVWTGSMLDGTRFFPMSGDEAMVGVSNETDYRWIWYGPEDPALREYPFYSISEPLEAVPAPGALILAVTGLLSSTCGLKRLRRKHQE